MSNAGSSTGSVVSGLVTIGSIAGTIACAVLRSNLEASKGPDYNEIVKRSFENMTTDERNFVYDYNKEWTGLTVGLGVCGFFAASAAVTLCCICCFACIGGAALLAKR